MVKIHELKKIIRIDFLKNVIQWYVGRRKHTLDMIYMRKKHILNKMIQVDIVIHGKRIKMCIM